MAHVHNHLYGVPSLLEKHRALGQYFPAPFTVMRLLTPGNINYHEAGYEYVDDLEGLDRSVLIISIGARHGERADD
ncbi:hypothetical protein [Nitrospira sp. Nam74]